MNNVLNTVAMEKQKLANLNKRVADFETAIDTLIQAPSNMLDGLGEIFDLFESGDALKKIYGFDPGPRPPATTANREQEQTNFDATQRVLQRLAVIQAASLAGDEEFGSYDEAVVERDSLADLLDEQAEIASDDTYGALQQLRADLTKAVPGEGGDLARLITHTPRSTVPSLVLTYSLYGEVSQEEDLLERNNISHPGFVMGGIELEVLSRA
jgi:hypothetical protein